MFGSLTPVRPTATGSSVRGMRNRHSLGWWWWERTIVLLLMQTILAVSETSSPSMMTQQDNSVIPTSSPPSPPSSPSSLQKKHQLSYIQFTQKRYRATIPENSVGKVYVIPESQMGISLNDTTSPMSIRFRIRSGDPEDFFKAEAERVGDFVFLVIRTRTSNLNVLNRERTASYKLDIRARVRLKGRKRMKLPEAKCIVRVEVLDTNDLDPFFQPSEYSFSVDEDT